MRPPCFTVIQQDNNGVQIIMYGETFQITGGILMVLSVVMLIIFGSVWFRFKERVSRELLETYGDECCFYDKRRQMNVQAAAAQSSWMEQDVPPEADGEYL